LITGTGIKPAEPDKGQGDKEFLKMNGNSYLGLSLNQEVIKLGSGQVILLIIQD